MLQIARRGIFIFLFFSKGMVLYLFNEVQHRTGKRKGEKKGEKSENMKKEIKKITDKTRLAEENI